MIGSWGSCLRVYRGSVRLERALVVGGVDRFPRGNGFALTGWRPIEASHGHFSLRIRFLPALERFCFCFGFAIS